MAYWWLAAFPAAFLVWWYLPDIFPLQSDTAANLFRAINFHDYQQDDSLNSPLVLTFGRLFAQFGILPTEGILAFFSAGAMFFLLLGTYILLQRISWNHLFSFSAMCWMGSTQPALWDATDFGLMDATSVLLVFGVMASALTKRYAGLGLFLAALMADSSCFWAIALAVLLWTWREARAGQQLGWKGKVLRNWMVGAFVIALLAYLMQASSNSDLIPGISEGLVPPKDEQSSMLGRLIQQPLQATSILLNLLLLAWRLGLRLLKRPQPGFSLLPLYVFMFLLLQEQLLPLSHGESVHIGGMLLCLQLLLALQWLDSWVEKGGKRLVGYALVLGVLALESVGWMAFDEPKDLELRKVIAAEQVELGRFIDRQVLHGDDVVCPEGLPAAFRHDHTFVVPESMEVETVLEWVAEFKPACIALPGYAAYLGKIDAAGYAEDKVFRESNRLGLASVHVWRLASEGERRYSRLSIPLREIKGESLERLDGLEVREISGKEMVFDGGALAAAKLRFGILFQNSSTQHLEVRQMQGDSTTSYYVLDLSGDDLPAGHRVHSVEIALDSVPGLQVSLRLKTGDRFCVFDPEWVL
jgi:hypothetical protein